ncbi:XRE family transcriptional regulator [Hymenobacter sp. B81]|uniref:XRE family transcriptional regulator n=1 Tax=Hymenobacter sp. B81 TaxID=3344878 RepID=UPI0037DCBCCE
MPATTINERLAAVRKALGHSPQAFADLLGFSRAYLANMESGRREVSLEVVMFLTETLNISADYILSERGPMFHLGTAQPPATTESANQSANLSANQTHPSKTKRTKNTQHTEDDKVRVLVVTQDTTDNLVSPVINRKAAANYLTGYQTQEYFEHLAYASLPPLLMGTRGKQTAIMPIVGDSMEEKFRDGDYVACVRLEPHEWDSIRDLDCYVIVSHTYGIQFKRIKNRLKQLGFIRCRSDNRRYPSFNIEAEDIIELWRFVLHLSADASNPNENLYQKLEWVEDTTSDLRDMYEGLRAEVEAMRKAVGSSRALSVAGKDAENPD